MDTTSIVTIILFGFGLFMLGFELVIPGFGLMGIGGALFLVLGVYSAMEKLTISLNLLLIIISIMAVIIFLFIKKALKSDKADSVILNMSLNKENQILSRNDRKDLLNKRGTTIGPLRPTGFADINGEKVEVVAKAGFIKSDIEIEVIEVKDSEVYVRRV